MIRRRLLTLVPTLFGVVTLVLLGGTIFMLFRLDAKKRRAVEHDLAPLAGGLHT